MSRRSRDGQGARGVRRTLALMVAAGTALVVAGGVSAQVEGDPPPPVPPGDRVYVANQGAARVSVIDAQEHRVVATVDLQELGFSANAKPHHIVVEPDGSHWYVSLIGENRILKLDADNRIVGQAEFEVPGMMALHPTEDLLLVGRSMSAVNPPQRIGVVRRSDMSVEEIPVFFPRPHAIAVSPDGRYVYTASLATNQIASVDIEAEDVALIPVRGPSHAFVQFAVSPDGGRLVASTQLTGLLQIYDLSDPARPELTDAVQVGGQPWHPVFAPDGRHVYVGNKTANTVTVVDAVEAEIAAVIEGGGIAEPHGSAVSPDGRYIYVSGNNTGGSYGGVRGDGPPPGTVAVIDAARRAVVAVIEVGANATGVGSPR